MKRILFFSLFSAAIFFTSCQTYPPQGHGHGGPQRYQGYHGEPAWKRNLKKKRRFSHSRKQLEEAPTEISQELKVRIG